MNFIHKMKTIRVRFAPSPTGPLHIGGVRTALYNYLYARKNKGVFILRIEDTDQNRYVQGAEDYIIRSLQWCGLDFDEGPGREGHLGPYRQSERKALYRQYAEQLVQSGHAYYAFDTPEELEAMRQRLKTPENPSPQYDMKSRMGMTNSLTLRATEVDARIRAGEPYVIRIKIPEHFTLTFGDLIRGDVTFDSSVLDDKVLFKSDGMPTYHLANVVDDYLMQVTHVIRGEEWLPSTPLHVLLYQFLGWQQAMPQFAHLPLILRPDGHGKLSKRDGDRLGFPVYPLEWTDPVSGEKAAGFRELGFLPEAFVNMLALLGWNPGTDQEIFTMDELIRAFSLERVGKSGARFDFEKARWFNQQYLRKKSPAELAALVSPVLESNGIFREQSYVEQLCALLVDRITFPQDFLIEGRYFFFAPETYDEKTIRKRWKPESATIFERLIHTLNGLEDFSAATVESAVHQFMEANKLRPGEVLPLLRIMLTGVTHGPAVFAIAALLGKQETLERMKNALTKFARVLSNA
ncbi:MAG: glutamate--tRNA ligase [Chitinophagales bacterium]|nr:MAG: glutamate--tRNA ligase [Chitinophagales bacterium]